MTIPDLVSFQGLDAPADKQLMKLFLFSYSPYARKVRAILDLSGTAYEAVEVPYGDRSALVAVTGGYLQVPVLVDGEHVLTDSRQICEHLLVGDVADALVPAPFQGPIWAYADFCDGPLEDVLFRLASPALALKKATAAERALFIYVKERKFGAGCVNSWHRDAEQLIARGKRLLGPTLETLRQTPFLFGTRPTLADAALYGNLAMLEAADPSLLSRLDRGLEKYFHSVEERFALDKPTRER